MPARHAIQFSRDDRMTKKYRGEGEKWRERWRGKLRSGDYRQRMKRKSPRGEKAENRLQAV